jgi:hypothetical protein
VLLLQCAECLAVLGYVLPILHLLLLSKQAQHVPALQSCAVCLLLCCMASRSSAVQAIQAPATAHNILLTVPMLFFVCRFCMTSAAAACQAS